MEGPKVPAHLPLPRLRARADVLRHDQQAGTLPELDDLALPAGELVETDSSLAS
jgi:hypothetical protein